MLAAFHVEAAPPQKQARVEAFWHRRELASQLLQRWRAVRRASL
jgi:hypothetical protein